jgi:hypothetical protein
MQFINFQKLQETLSLVSHLEGNLIERERSGLGPINKFFSDLRNFQKKSQNFFNIPFLSKQSEKLSS